MDPIKDNMFRGFLNYETWGALLWLDTEPERRGHWEGEVRQLHAEALADGDVNFQWQMVREACVLRLAERLRHYTWRAICPEQLKRAEVVQAVEKVQWVDLAQEFVDRYLPLECAETSINYPWEGEPDDIDPYHLPDDER